MSNIIRITRAELDLRGKTKFIHVNGLVMADSFDEEVTVSKFVGGDEQNLLVLEVDVTNNRGPKKRQFIDFDYSEALFDGHGNKWTHVQVTTDNWAYSDFMPITILKWSVNTEETGLQLLGDGGISGGPK